MNYILNEIINFIRNITIINLFFTFVNSYALVYLFVANYKRKRSIKYLSKLRQVDQEVFEFYVEQIKQILGQQQD